jgi:hypothetical protein
MGACEEYLDLVIKNEDAGAYTTASDMRAIYERALRSLARNNCRKELLYLINRYKNAGAYTTASDRRAIQRIAFEYLEKLDRGEKI